MTVKLESKIHSIRSPNPVGLQFVILYISLTPYVTIIILVIKGK